MPTQQVIMVSVNIHHYRLVIVKGTHICRDTDMQKLTDRHIDKGSLFNYYFNFYEYMLIMY